MHSRTWTSTIITTVSLAVTLATASIGFCRMIIPGTRPMNDILALPTGGGGGGGLPPEQPGYPPRQPVVTGPVSRTTTSLTIRLTDRSSYEQGYELSRGSSATGPWTLLSALAPFSGQVDYTDSGLSPDAPYWYRLRAYNVYGESSTVSFPFSTLDGRSVWRVQLRLRTANVSDAGTDDSIRVELNGPNLTWLDYGRDDFERGSDLTYDLNLDGVSDLSDLQTIYIHKEGTDGWCLESLTLLVNSREANPVEIFHQDFGATASTCQWIDRGDGHAEFVSVSRAALRAHLLWQSFQQPPPPLSLLRDELESRIEGLVGDALHGTDAYWGDLDGPRYVEVSRQDDQAVHVTLDLVASVPLSGDPEVDVSFDLRFIGACTDGQTPLVLHIVPENIHAAADADWWEEVATFWISFLENAVADAVVNAFPDLERSITVNPGTPVCITPLVGSTGNVSLLPSAPPPSGGTTPPTTGGIRPIFAPATALRALR